MIPIRSTFFWLLMGVGIKVTLVRCEVSVKQKSFVNPQLNYALMVRKQLLRLFVSRLSVQVSFISSLASKLCLCRSFHELPFWDSFPIEMRFSKLLVSCKHAHMMSFRNQRSDYRSQKRVFKSIGFYQVNETWRWQMKIIKWEDKWCSHV